MSTWIPFFEQYSQYDLFILPHWLFFDILCEAKEKRVLLPFQIKVDYQYQSRWNWEYYLFMKQNYQMDPYLAKNYTQFYWLVDRGSEVHQHLFPSVYAINQTIKTQSFYPFLPELVNQKVALVADANVDLCFQTLPRIELPLLSTHHDIPVISCQDEEEQIHATLQQVAKQLDEGIHPEQIKILQVHPLSMHRYQQMAMLYGISLHDSSSRSWSQSPLGITIYHTMAESPSKTVILELITKHSTTPNIHAIQEWMEQLPDEVCKDYELFRFLLDEWTTSFPTPKGTIELSSSLAFQAGSLNYLHIQSAIEDVFPKPILDSTGLTQEQRTQLGLPSLRTLQEHAMNQGKVFIQSHPNTTYYYPRNAHGVVCRASRVFESFSTSIQTFKNTYPSPKSAALHYAYARYLKQTFDREEASYPLFHSLFEPKVKRYNPQFKPISNQTSERLLHNHISLSATSIELFHHCPFHYLLTYRLKLDPSISHFAIDTGIFAHRTLQEYFSDSLAKEDPSFPSLSNRSPAYQAWIKETLRKRLDEIAIVLSQQLQGSQFHNEAFELQIQVPLQKDSRYQLVGTIDRLMITQKDEEVQGVVLDYKTGSTGFSKADFDKGIDVQLILYGFLMEQKQCSIDIIGFFHQPIILGKLPRMDTKDPLTNLSRMDGIVLKDESVVRAFDSLSFLRGIQINDNGRFKAGSENRFFTKMEKQEMYQALQQKIETMIDSIHHGQYFIKPLPLEKNQTISKSCEFCPYQNICFLANKRDPFELEALQEEEGDETNA